MDQNTSCIFFHVFCIFCSPMWILVAQRLAIEFFLDLIYFPIWWYTGGLVHQLRVCRDLMKDGNRALGPGLWLRNMFVPMFGQYDWQGRIVSFFMRLVNVIGRAIALWFWLWIVVGVFLLWIIFPVFVAYMLFLSLT